MTDSITQNKRREKPVLSCSFCRGRKLRCDRQDPCGACMRRGKPEECLYITSEQERRVAVDYRPRARNNRAHQRLANLEKLVTELRDKEAQPRRPSNDASSVRDSPSQQPPSMTSSESSTAANIGTLALTPSHAVYIGGSHWIAMLEDIRKLKDDMEGESMDGDSELDHAPLDVVSVLGVPASRITLLASATCFAREQIMAMMPARRVVDRLVSHFFNAFDFAPLILHQNTFLTEYANFWANPSTTPIMWVGLLFSVMSLSKLLQQPDVGPMGLSDSEFQDMLETYRTLTIHCLIAGDYMQPTKYTIETLTLHFAVDQQLCIDAYTGNWILIGTVVRIAMRMGLHRDPSHWPSIRPLPAEMRRRIWMTLYQMDFFTSTQMGLPRLIKDSQCDTKPPMHLVEQDILPEHDEMPQERPATESTPLLYLIERYKIMKVVAEIYDATEGMPILPTTVATLTTKLNSAVVALPQCLKYEAMETSIADDPVKMLQRIFIDILIKKAIYLLHRQGFMQDGAGHNTASPDLQCIDAALAILDHQRRINEEIQPGGLLFNIRWKVTASLNHEFLQATMMLCYVLSRSKESTHAVMASNTLHRQRDIIDALNIAKESWEKEISRSLEAGKAVEAITTALRGDLRSLVVKNSDPFYALQGIPETILPDYFGNFDPESFMALDYSITGTFPTFGE